MLHYLIIYLSLMVFLSGLFQGKILTFADEIILFLCLFLLLLFVLKGRVKKSKELFFILVFYIFYQILNYFISPFELNLFYVLLQSIINIKLFIVAYVMSIVVSDRVMKKRYYEKLLLLFVFIYIVCFVLNIIFAEQWNVMLKSNIYYRYDILRPIGAFGSTGVNAYFFCMTFFSFLMLKYNKVKNVKTLSSLFVIYAIINIIMIYPLTVRKGLYFVIAFAVVYFVAVGSVKKFYAIIVVMILSTFFIPFLMKNQILIDTYVAVSRYFYDDDSGYIRGLVANKGMGLFSEFFPFGVGAGTFGTVLSQYHTFEVYKYVGFDLGKIYFNKGMFSGIFDSGIFSYAAENGFIGIVILFILIVSFVKYNKEKLLPYNYIVFKILTYSSIMLSFSEPVWQNGFYTVFYLVNLLFIYENDVQMRREV